MHIPDGFLDTKTIVATSTLSVIGVGAAWRETRLHVPAGRVPLLGLAAAFVFASQMLNFPVAGGTSGHLIGAVLAAVLLGPGAAIVVITSVLVVQCFLFADGGVLALGANVLNMALVGSLSGYYVYRPVSSIFRNETGNVVALMLASWVSVVLASLFCAGELAWSGTVSWYAAFPAIAGVHAVIGIGEAMITWLVITAIRRARPDLLGVKNGEGRKYGHLIVYGFVVVLGLVIFVSPFASPWPDGLDSVATRFGFDRKALETVPALMPGYRFPGIESSAVSTIIGGVIGVAVLVGVALVLSRALRAKH